MLSEENKCIACSPGYHGANCTRECSYPYYGRKCLEGECKCPEELCNIATGCKQTTTEIQSVSTSPVKSKESLDYLNATLTGSSTLNSAQQKVKDGASSTKEIFKNPILLGIFGVNFIFLTLILAYVCKRTRKCCLSKTSKDNQRKISDQKAEHHYEEIDPVQTNSDISIDYSRLNMAALYSSPNNSLSSPESSNFNESGKSTSYSYDDIANVGETP
ncbi:uncharacterized protein LOC133204092 [Saccostrea echinata]|uniref:uncharacterized protein LOC133204092 n=1 Tax=Saccostrea echinata TaxID=191078 RepID=UPI002A7FFD2C|nr:uncharacterized protein LOC133204092 [Saccostrea echinata]